MFASHHPPVSLPLLLAALLAATQPGRAEEILNEESPRVTVGGLIRFTGALFDDDRDRLAPPPFDDQGSVAGRVRGDLWIEIEDVTETGLTYGLYAELRATDPSDEAQERYAYVSAVFGEALVGQLRGAIYDLAALPPVVGAGQIDGTYADFAGWRTALGPGALVLDGRRGGPDVFATDDDYSPKLTLLSPQIEGFRLGASYAPELDDIEEIVERTPRNRLGQPEHGVQVAASYETELEASTLALSAGYSFAESDVAGTEDLSSYQVGITLTYGPFVGGASFVDLGDSLAPTASDQDAREVALGVTYENGPYGVGLSAAFQFIAADALGQRLDFDRQIYAVGVAARLSSQLELGIDALYFAQKNYYALATGWAGEDDEGYLFVTELTAEF